METKDIFLCHSSVDKEWVRNLAAALERELSATHSTLNVFLDEWDIAAGENIVWKLDEGLKKSRLLGIVMSPEMMGSDWCKLEVSSFLMNDPLNRKRRVLPLLLRDSHLVTKARLEIPPVLQAMKYLDFRHEREFALQYSRLVSAIRGEAPPRGGRTAREQMPKSSLGSARDYFSLERDRHLADPTKEVLISNLLPVELPRNVWTAPTFLAKKQDLHEFYKYPAFIVREGQLFSFVDLSARGNPFADFITAVAEVESFPLTHWFDKPDQWRWAIELLNDSLRRFLYKKKILFHPRGDRYFFRGDDRGSVFVRWGRGTRRCVARAPDEGKRNWVHQAARLKFETLGDKVFLSIEPSYMFTVDGRNPVPSDEAGPLAMKWGGKERNGTIFRHTLMWSDAITSGRRSALIGDGDQAIKIDRLPSIAHTTAGIVGDHVAVGAMLEFTEIENNLRTEEEASFEFLPAHGSAESLKAPEAEA